MADLQNENEKMLPENAKNVASGSQNQVADEAELKRLALKDKKRRTLINWLRVTALLFAGFFFLSQCAMSKPRAKAAIVESCIKNVPFSPVWQEALKTRNLSDENGKYVADYCVCMWNEPLQKLSDKQIQSFAKISTDEQLQLLGGAAAFTERDKQCMAKLQP
ncbi:MAG: hypothetical protein Q4B82_04250 [Alysiella sp.]|uniref:hypothetical protein n=1 Tax=Alysiella sp. TaxID=1872483 RepID=UPI0026DBA3D8|nr:hypothetical protein [Alysiella sp.]MDO4433773.1 hypothetical protein [Alysiella sp.]